MNRKNLTVILLMSIFLTGQAFCQDNKKDVELIKKTILSAYQDGLQNEGDLKKIDEGFHPVFRMIAVNKDGEIWEYPISEWKKATELKVQEGKLPKPESSRVNIKIPMVDVTGIAAVAKLEFYVGEKLTFIDYMSLYKLDGKWKIVAKIYNAM